MVRVGVGTRAVARAKVPPVPVRKLRAAIPRQRKTRKNRRVFCRGRRVDILNQKESFWGVNLAEFCSFQVAHRPPGLSENRRVGAILDTGISISEKNH